MNSGTDLARDIETGFLNRLALTPLRGAALLAGLLAGVARRSASSRRSTYLAVGLIAGAELRRRRRRARWCSSRSRSAITVAFGSIGLFAALRIGSGEAVQGLFPVFFVFLFLSSMALPLRPDRRPTGSATIATVNPVSYLLEGIRSLLIEGWDGEALALGFGIARGDRRRRDDWRPAAP